MGMATEASFSRGFQDTWERSRGLHLDVPKNLVERPASHFPEECLDMSHMSSENKHFFHLDSEATLRSNAQTIEVGVMEFHCAPLFFACGRGMVREFSAVAPFIRDEQAPSHLTRIWTLVHLARDSWIQSCTHY